MTASSRAPADSNGSKKRDSDNLGAANKLEPGRIDVVDLWKSARNKEKDRSNNTNKWTLDAHDEHGLDRLRLRAEYRGSEDELLKANPDLKGKLDPSDKTQKFYLRHPTTGEKDGGWSLSGRARDGSYILRRDYSLNVQARKGHDGLIEAMQGVPDSFVSRLERKLDQLPENVRLSLARHGYKIIAAGTICDAMPGLKGLTPRGWPADTTFDHSDGTHDDVSKRIIAPMRVLGGWVEPGSGWQPVTRENVLTHQIGHALDFAHGFLSARKEFVDAYEADMAKISDKDNPVVKYLSQKNGVGRQETFASIFGLLTTGTENESDKEFFEKNFPSVIRVVKKQIKEMK